MKKILFLIYTVLIFEYANSQIIYFNDVLSNIYSLNVQTCAVTILSGGPAVNDMAIANNGNFYGLLGSNIINIATGNVIGFIPDVVTGLELGPNGILYALGTNVWAFDLATNTLTNNGALPNNWFCTGDLVFYNGQFYATVYDITSGGNHQLITVDVNNPANTTIVSTPPVNTLVAGAAVGNSTCPKLYWFNSEPGQLSELWEYDINTQTWTTLCPNFAFIAGGADTPNGYTFAIACGCSTDAGNIPGGSVNACTNVQASIPSSQGSVLESDDILRYIVFTNLNDTLGSIILNTASPVFTFNPAIFTPGTTYYVAAIAGNNNNGQVSLTDPCLSISNAVELTWRILPGVTLQNPNQPICAGECIDINLNFSGAPPFALTYSTPFAGPQTQSFQNPLDVLNICIPVGQAAGGLQLQTLSVQDSYCICP
jgi:hypothetical protein